MGACVGTLTSSAATHLGLTAYYGLTDTHTEGLKVTQGGPDAYVGMLGLGCVQAGQLALVTGSR